MDRPYKIKFGESSTQTEIYAVVRDDGVYYESAVFYEIEEAMSLQEDLNFAWRTGRESQAATIARLTAELDEARAVVERLPKTADGVRLAPGDVAYYPKAYYSEDGDGPSRMTFHLCSGYEGDISAESCYASLEAAERAKGDE